MTGHERVVIAAAVEDESQVPHHHLGAEPAVQAGGERDHVAFFVHYGDIAGIAFVIGMALYVDVARAVYALKTGREAPDIAGAKLKRRYFWIDQFAALGGVV